MVVGIVDAFVELLSKFVFRCVWRGIPDEPEVFRKAFSLRVRRQLFESLTFGVGDDIGDVIVRPILQHSSTGFGFLLFCFFLLLSDRIDRLFGWLIFLCASWKNGKNEEEGDSQGNASTAHRHTSVSVVVY